MMNNDETDPANTEESVLMLLADDSRASHLLLKNILKPFSCELDSAMNGAEAVEKFKSRPYDLIFMDSHMPVLDGLTAIREIRALERSMGRPATPIVLMTADNSQEDVESASAAGADNYLAKPITKDSVAAVINKFFAVDGDDGSEEERLPSNQAETARESSCKSSDTAHHPHTDSNPSEDSTALNPTRDPAESIASDSFVVRVDEEIIALIPSYLERRKKELPEFREALERGDFDALKAKGHTLKGSGGGYGFDKLTDIGRAIEDAAKSADYETIREQIDRMAVYLENVRIERK